MLRIKPLLLRFLTFSIAYFLLLLLFRTAPAQELSSRALSGLSGAFLSVALPDGYIQVRQAENEARAGEYNLDVFFGNKERALEQMEQARISGQSTASLDLHTFQIRMEEFFLMPIIFFLALVLMTPARWRRKLGGSAAGLLLLLVFCCLKLVCFTLYNFAAFPSGVYELKGLAVEFVTAVYFYAKMGVGVLAASLIWVAVIFRYSDWRSMLLRLGD
ncbi:MAG: hypothetical protein RI973_1266 [Bacteroidota bacterium]|jgi:hypothetical protein